MNLLTLCYCTFFTLLYFLPTIVGRGKANSDAIFLLNLLLGWSVIGWIVALIWARTKDPVLMVAAPAPSAAILPLTSVEDPRIIQLKGLRDAGTLTQTEFMEQISQLLNR